MSHVSTKPTNMAETCSIITGSARRRMEGTTPRTSDRVGQRHRGYRAARVVPSVRQQDTQAAGQVRHSMAGGVQRRKTRTVDVDRAAGQASSGTELLSEQLFDHLAAVGDLHRPAVAAREGGVERDAQRLADAGHQVLRRVRLALDLRAVGVRLADDHAAA